eukprot:667769-Pleurochrysis_carterae.AAC.1
MGDAWNGQRRCRDHALLRFLIFMSCLQRSVEHSLYGVRSATTLFERTGAAPPRTRLLTSSRGTAMEKEAWLQQIFGGSSPASTLSTPTVDGVLSETVRSLKAPSLSASGERSLTVSCDFGHSEGEFTYELRWRRYDILQPWSNKPLPTNGAFVHTIDNLKPNTT